MTAGPCHARRSTAAERFWEISGLADNSKVGFGNLGGLLKTPMYRSPLDRVRGTRPGDLTVTVSARITQAEAIALISLAQSNRCSKASIIRELLREALGEAVEVAQ
jgi:hypothetical protein